MFSRICSRDLFRSSDTDGGEGARQATERQHPVAVFPCQRSLSRMGDQKDDHVAHATAAGDSSSPCRLLDLSAERRRLAVSGKERHHAALRSRTLLPLPLEVTRLRIVRSHAVDSHRISATPSICKHCRFPSDLERRRTSGSPRAGFADSRTLPLGGRQSPGFFSHKKKRRCPVASSRLPFACSVASCRSDSRRRADDRSCGTLPALLVRFTLAGRRLRRASHRRMRTRKAEEQSERSLHGDGHDAGVACGGQKEPHRRNANRHSPLQWNGVRRSSREVPASSCDLQCGCGRADGREVASELVDATSE